MFHFNSPKKNSPTTSRRARRQTKKARSPERRRARFEFLEDRRVLAVLTVNSVGDAPADTSALTLRDAITLVNNAGDPSSLGQSSMPAAWASQIAGNFGSNDTIQFDPSLAGTPIALAHGELLISAPLTITGLPAAGTTIEASNGSRIFDITSAAGAVTLDRLTIAGGNVTQNTGGAVYCASSLTISNSNVSASTSGGGIFALGDVTVTNSTVEGNEGGAGIESASGAVTVTNSTVYQNFGGIFAEHGPVTVDNSTVFDNQQFGVQAGTSASDGPLTVRSSIVAGNIADAGGLLFPEYDLLYNPALAVTVSNSLIGHNDGSGLAEAPVGSPDANGNFIGGPIHGAIDPRLQTGAYYNSGSSGRHNGGPTDTFMLLPGSPAIDTGANPDNLATDQRGAPFARTSGGKTDRGAFELQTSQLTPTLTLSAPGGVYGGPAVKVEVAGTNGPAEPDLEGVPVAATYYAGSSATGTPLQYPYQPGTYTVVGNFAGSAEYTAASLAPTTYTITKAPTTTAVVARTGENPAVAGQTVDFFVTVAVGGYASPFTTGVVTLWDGATPLLTKNLDQRDYYFYTLEFSINGLSVGTHSITATYGGDADYGASTSAVFNEVINQASTTTQAFSSPDSSPEYLAGLPVTLTADVGVVNPGAGTPTGSVTFWDGATLLGTGTVAITQTPYGSPDQATFTTNSLAIGTHNITARYGGDTNFTASSSDFSVEIQPAEAVTITSSASQSTASFGQNVTLTANVSVVDPSVPAPTGAVQFQVDGNNIGNSVPVNAAGNASIATSSLALGSHRITALYNGTAAVDTATGLLSGTISTFAGSGAATYTLPTPAKAAVLSGPLGTAVDSAGDLFIADAGAIRKVDAKTGIMTVIGSAPPSPFNEFYPGDLVGMVCDAFGNLYYSVGGMNVVEKVSPLGVVTTVAGTLSSIGGESGDGGLATAARLNDPRGLALDAAGDLFIADEGVNGRVREVNTAGIITTVAGGVAGEPTNGDGGPATAATLHFPTGIAVNSAGDLFVADTGDGVLRRVDHATGIISTLANPMDSFWQPQGLALDAAGDLFIADGSYSDVAEVTPSGVWTTFAGTNGSSGFGGDGGQAAAALLSAPTALTFDATGDLFIADTGNGRIREVNPAGTISTVAGGGTLGNAGNGQQATDAPLDNPPGPLAVDAAGDVFIAESNFNVVREVSPAGIITTVAGQGGARGYSGDGGPATAAQLSRPDGLAADDAGDLYIADGLNNVIRKVTPAGVITTIAGNGIAAYSGDGGAATAASLNAPGALAVDTAGDLFIADAGNQVIRKVTPAGIISTVLQSTYATGLAADGTGDLFISEGADVRELTPHGVIATIAGDPNGRAGYAGDGGPANGALLSSPQELAFDGAGNLLIVDAGNNVIRAISSAGIISTIAGIPSQGGYGGMGDGDGGPATSAHLYFPTGLFPTGLAVDAAGDLFIVDGEQDTIRKVTPSLVVTQDATTTTVATSSASPVFGQAVTFTVSVAAAAPGAGTPTGTVQLVVDGQNSGGPLTLGANDTVSLTTSALSVGSHTIAAVYSGDADFKASIGNTGLLVHGTIKTVVGTGVLGYSGDAGPATAAKLNFGANTTPGVSLVLGAVAVDAAGDLFIADTFNNVIREVSPAGVITTVAGNGTPGYSGDGGLATNAQLNRPNDVKVDAAGDLFIADSVNNVIREVFPNGTIETVAGDGAGGYSGDGGPATNAELWYPTGIAVDAFGDLFIADLANAVVREVTTDGIIHTVARNGTQGYTGDGGPATAAEFLSPTSVAVDGAGDLFITDLGNNVVREVTPDGNVHTVAGNGTQGYSGDGGSATAAELEFPNYVTVDAAGNLFISDTFADVIREVSAGVIRTVAGNGTVGYSGDGGTATVAKLNEPDGIAVDAHGSLFIVDAGNDVVREVTPTLIVSRASTTTTLVSSNSSSPYGQSATFTATVAVVAPGAGTPTGTVSFYDGATLLGTGTLNSAGQATFSTSKLSIATHTISAVYSGDGNFAGGASAALTQSVLSGQQEIAVAVNQVQALVTSGVLNKGNGKMLSDLLNRATTSLSQGNTLTGLAQLGDFALHVGILRLTRKLDGADATTLINDALAAAIAAIDAKLA